MSPKRTDSRPIRVTINNIFLKCRITASNRLAQRAAIGGGKAVIGSNVKVAAAGALIDVPLVHKDDSWSFPHFDTITVSVADAPRPDEILVVMAIADGGRLRNRCGTEPIR
jgi:hypothetical protein